jgi:hypothetical protein
MQEPVQLAEKLTDESWKDETAHCKRQNTKDKIRGWYVRGGEQPKLRIEQKPEQAHDR